MVRIDPVDQAFAQTAHFPAYKLLPVKAVVVPLIIRVLQMVDFRGKGATPQFVRDLGSEGHGHHAAAMEAVGKSHNGASAGMLAGNLYGVFNRFGTGGGKHHFGVFPMREEGDELFGQLHVQIVGGHIEAGMDQFPGLVAYGLYHRFGAMARVLHPNAPGKVDQFPAIGVAHDGIAGRNGCSRVKYSYPPGYY